MWFYDDVKLDIREFYICNQNIGIDILRKNQYDNPINLDVILLVIVQCKTYYIKQYVYVYVSISIINSYLKILGKKLIIKHNIQMSVTRFSICKFY